AGGQIADRTIAEPAAIGPDIDVLGDRELTARASNEIPVGGHIGGNRPRINELPAGALDGAADRLIRRQHRHAEAGLRPVSRQVEEFEQIGVFRPEIALAAAIDVLYLVFP